MPPSSGAANCRQMKPRGRIDVRSATRSTGDNHEWRSVDTGDTEDSYRFAVSLYRTLISHDPLCTCHAMAVRILHRPLRHRGCRAQDGLRSRAASSILNRQFPPSYCPSPAELSRESSRQADGIRHDEPKAVHWGTSHCNSSGRSGHDATPQPRSSPCQPQNTAVVPRYLLVISRQQNN